MKLAVVSDSHGHTENVGRLAARLNKLGVRTALHLGDDYDDAASLLAAGLDLKRVPGVFSDYYRDPDTPNRLSLEMGGLRMLLTHAPEPHDNDLPEDGDPAEIASRDKPDLVLYGHTHLPAVEDRGGVLWVNPGHLKPEDKKGAPPTFAVIDAAADPPAISILRLEDGTVYLAHP
jgi:putative phosphoesterase